ncbi:MAG: TraB/GumN family protein, partial [Woeseiaceae bacterium]
MLLYRIGFDPMLGVEMTMTARATADGKPIEGLETVDEQLAFLDELPIAAQREMLLQTLLEGADLEMSIDTLIEAWRNGDTATLERELLSGIEDQDELHEALIVQRNRRWASTIGSWLDDEQDYLVVVGALHLVGENGVPALLDHAGFEIQQLKEYP